MRLSHSVGELGIPFVERYIDWAKHHTWFFPDGRKVHELSLKNNELVLPRWVKHNLGEKDIKEKILQNALFIEKEEGYDIYLVRYYPKNNENLKKFNEISYSEIPSDWSGTIDIYGFSDYHIQSFLVEEGKLTKKGVYNRKENNKENINTNSQTTCTTYWLDFDYYPIEGGVGSSQSIMVEICYSNLPDGGSSGPPESGGGGTGGNYPGGPGNDKDGMICDANTGQCIPLPGTEPYTSFGFPANPSDGDTFTVTYPDGNQITFTYNQSLDGWLMPEFQGLIDLGYTIDNAHTFPSFNGQLLTLIAWNAALEPTFIGEIIFGSAVIIMSTIYVYDLAKFYFATQDKLSNLEHCMKLYENCIENKPHLPCGKCLGYCDANGYWDSDCPDVMVK